MDYFWWTLPRKLIHVILHIRSEADSFLDDLCADIEIKGKEREAGARAAKRLRAPRPSDPASQKLARSSACTYDSSMDEYRIRDLEHLKALWHDIYSISGRIDWSRMLLYYAEDIHFQDAVQEIRGKRRFVEMTRRLAKRSKKLRFVIHGACMRGDLVFMEWEMLISYKSFPESSVYGTSRLLLREGKVADQRDYYDLWGDIWDNIPVFSRLYRAFMRWGFG